MVSALMPVLSERKKTGMTGRSSLTLFSPLRTVRRSDHCANWYDGRPNDALVLHRRVVSRATPTGRPRMMSPRSDSLR